MAADTVLGDENFVFNPPEFSNPEDDKEVYKKLFDVVKLAVRSVFGHMGTLQNSACCG